MSDICINSSKLTTWNVSNDLIYEYWVAHIQYSTTFVSTAVKLQTQWFTRLHMKLCQYIMVPIWFFIGKHMHGLRCHHHHTKVSQMIWFTINGWNIWSMLWRQLFLAHWGRVMLICAGKLAIIGSDNGLSPGRRQAIIWTNAGILLIGPLGTNFSEILIAINAFSFNKMHLKISSAKWRQFRLGLNVLNNPATTAVK